MLAAATPPAALVIAISAGGSVPHEDFDDGGAGQAEDQSPNACTKLAQFSGPTLYVIDFSGA
jgi:hypothetical protein